MNSAVVGGIRTSNVGKGLDPSVRYIGNGTVKTVPYSTNVTLASGTVKTVPYSTNVTLASGTVKTVPYGTNVTLVHTYPL